MKVTIKKIAELAGVSRGTVDRVLNNRPNVKPEIREKVLSIASELNYTPNKVAKALAHNNKPVIIGIVVPPKEIPFFNDVYKGIIAAENELKDFGLEVKCKHVSNQSPEDCLSVLDKFVEEKTDGIALSVMDSKVIRDRVNQLVDSGIPVVTFNSDIPRSKRLCFIGQDLYKSGRVAAGLMSKFTDENSKILIVTGSMEFHAHKARVNGFVSRLKELNKRIHIVDIVETYDRYSITYDKVSSYLKKYTKINGIYMAAGDLIGCVKAVNSFATNGKIRLICNDLLPETKELIIKGQIDFTICQDPFTQGYKPIKILYDCIFTGKKPEKEFEFTDIDIVIAENLE